MTEYNPCSKEFQEEVKKLGLTGFQYIQKLREEGKLVNTTKVKRETDNKMAQKRGYKDINEYNKAMYHKEDPYLEGFQEGTIGWLKDRLKGKGISTENLSFGELISLGQENKILNVWTDIHRELLKNTIKNSGCKNYSEYLDKFAKKHGYNTHSEYTNEVRYINGIRTPLSENKDCESYFGVYVVEHILNKFLPTIFDYVEYMKYGNRGFDFICKDPKKEFIDRYPQLKLKRGIEYKIQSTARCLDFGTDYFHFPIMHNDIAEYFIFSAWDNRDNLNLLHIWMINKNDIVRERKFWRRDAINITNRHKYLIEFNRYEIINELDKLKEIIRESKNNEFQK